MLRRCCAGYCSNTKDKDKGICLHGFPHGDKKRLDLWNRFVKTKRKDWVRASTTSLLCSAHFRETDFTNIMEYKMGFVGQLYLKETAVPSIHGTVVTGSSTSDETVPVKPRAAAVKLSLHRPHGKPTTVCKGVDEEEEDSVGQFVQHQLPEPCNPESTPAVSQISSCQSTDAPTSLEVLTRGTQYSRKHFQRNKGCQTKPAKVDKGTQTPCVTEQQDVPVSSAVAPNLPVCSTPRKHRLQSEASDCTPMKLVRLSSPEDSPIKNDDNDPDYFPSNLSFEEESAEKEMELQSESQSEVTHYIPSADSEAKFIVFQSCLEELFRTCPLCVGESQAMFPPTETGTAITVTQICKEVSCGFKRVWNSQPKVGRYFAGNIMASASLLFSGNQFSKLNRFFSYLHLPFISKTAYEEHQNKFLFPVIENMWQEQQREMIEEVKALGEGLHIGGDGRADSPGHSAKYGTYTTMELHLGKVINLQLVQSNEVKNSNWMELEGLKRSIDCLTKERLEIEVIVTDRHRSVAKWIRENLKETKHYFDIWHVAKGLGKKLDKLGQMHDCGLVKEWKKSIVNHLYWCAASTPDGNPEVMLAKWKSLNNHILGIHDGHTDPLFTKCQHGPLGAPRKKKWFKPGEKVTVQLETLLTDTWLQKDVRQLSPLGQTSSLEGFHSTILHFAPKHTGFQYKSMHYRVILAAMHFNENTGRSRAYKRSGEKQLTVYFSKAKKGEPSVRWEKVAPTYSYGHQLMRAVVEGVTSNPVLLSRSLQHMNVPPPLSSAMENVDREVARQKFGTYHRYGQTH